MQSWLLWAGISFIVGGAVSWGLTAGATEFVRFQEDVSGYAIGWILVGIVLVGIGFVKRKK